MMGLSDYMSSLIQCLRVAELNLSKKFKMFIVRIIMICMLLTVWNVHQIAAEKPDSKFLGPDDSGSCGGSCCILDESRTGGIYRLRSVHGTICRGSGINACCESHGIIPKFRLIPGLLRSHPKVPALRQAH